MDEKLILMDGTEIESARGMDVNGRLFLYLLGRTDLGEAFDMFYNQPQRTGEIRCQGYGQETVYSGYTSLFSINRENGNINLCMVKEGTI